MEWNPQTLQILSDCFLNSFSPLPEPRRAAEKALAEASEKPSFALAVLRLVAEPSVDEKIQQAAAVAFKNHLKSRWASNDGVSITDGEKEQIKALIVSLMLKATPKIQAQLSEALSVIGKHDFPKSWPTLLPELVSSLERLSQTGDYVSINGVLATLDSLFKKFGHEHKSDALWLDLKYCLDNFAKPLLLLFQWTASLIDQAVAQGANAASLKLYIECQRLCCWIFYSLNYQDLPEFFEDHMSEWMVEFKKYLTVRYPALEDASSEGLELVDSLRAAVCVNISLYAAKDEESFQVYMSGFVEAVWLLLISTSASPSREQLTVTAIKFLSTVSRGVHHSLFASDSVLHQICEGIVIPNVMLREEDVELFDFDSIEFIRRDMEGSDVDTRRRIACELLKGIAEHYKENVTQKASSQIQSLLDSFSKNPAANWKHKDCAIYLVVSLASWKADGASFSIDLVNIESFFGSVIVPELRSQQVNDFPILKAAALKFFTTFRNQLSKPIALSLLPDLVRFLTSDSIVVHSYAASCIEKLLLVKDGEGRLRYTGADIGPSLMPLMNNLYGSLQKQESEENQYIMKCIMRVLSMADINPDVALVCIKYLTEVLRRVCANPKSPVFNHYLFESVAALVRRASERDRSVIPAFENCLFPGLQKILAEDISEFFPYAFQLLAQLVEITPSLDNYVQIFVILLSPDIWNKSANVPALVYLLQAFLRKSPHEMMAQQERLKSILEIFGRLVSSSRSSDQGFYVLNTVIENISYDVIQPHVGNIWRALFTKLHQNSKSVKLIKNLIVFMSLFLVRYGADRLVQSMNDVQADIFHTILTQFWIPNLKQITGFMELKLTSVASTKLICESPNILNSELWVKMLDSNVTLLCQPEKKRVDDELEVPDFAETAGYNASFARLYSVGKKDEDPLKEIKDPKQFFVVALSRTCAASPGVYTPIISNNLDQSNQAALLQLCNQFNVSLV